MKAIEYLLLSVVLSLITLSCSQKTDKNKSLSAINDVEDTRINVLKEFYKEYISVSCNLPESYDSLKKVKRKYLSNDLYKRLDIVDLDYDPFLNAQDCDENWLKTIKIKPIQNENNIYQVCYNNGNKDICVTLSLINNNKKIAINEIKNNADLLTVISKDKKTEEIAPSYNIKGDWFTICNETTALKIEKENEALLPVISNQIYIKAKIETTKDNFYNVYLIEPDDLGVGGLQLDWDNFSTEKPIANIEILHNGKMSFKWIGFYHIIDKKIIIPKCEFNLETDSNPSILTNCLSN